MLRWVVWMLVVANAGYFAWTQGYLAALGFAPSEQAEPERLQAQIKPESLRLLNGPKGTAGAEPAPPAPSPAPVAEPSASEPAAATEIATLSTPTAKATPEATVSAPVPAVPPAPSTACWQASGFSTAQADSLRAALTLLDLPRNSWQLNESQTGGRWVVYMGRYSEELMVRKKTELRELGVEFREVSTPSLGPGLALGTYSSEAAAQQALQDIARKGVRTARVAQERAEGVTVSLRLPAATDAQRATVAGIGRPLAGKSLQRCD